MLDRNDDKFLDELLDAGLRQFSASPPRGGLEGRAIAALRAGASAKPRRYWVWAMAGGLAVLAAVVVTVLRHPSSPIRPQASSSAKANPPAALPSVPLKARPSAIAPVAKVKLLQGRQTKRSVSRQRPEQFPTPRPLSEEERLLLVYVSNLTPQAVNATSMQDQSAEPEIPALAITALQIKPLEGEQPIQEK